MNYNSILCVQLIEDYSCYDYTDKDTCANEVSQYGDQAICKKLQLFFQ